MSSPGAVDELFLQPLSRLPFADRTLLPRLSAVYFALTDPGAVLYMGATEDLRRRWWSSHHHENRLAQSGCATIAWHEVAPAALATVERAMIERFAPRLNREWRRRRPLPLQDITKVPISMRAVTQRLNRRLAKQQQCCKSSFARERGGRSTDYLVDRALERGILTDVDPIVLARGLGLLADWEMVVEEGH